VVGQIEDDSGELEAVSQAVVSEACYLVERAARMTVVVAEAVDPIVAVAAEEAGPIAGSEAAGIGSAVDTAADTAADTGCQSTDQGSVARSPEAAVGSPGEVVGSLEGIVDILVGAVGPGSLAAGADHQRVGL